jgi:hypothetical protein
MLPIAVGQTKDGGSEFGDIYHVGAALFLDKALRSVLVGKGDIHDKYYHFLTKLAGTERVEQLKYNLYRDRHKKFARAGESTDVIRKMCAQTGTMDHLQRLILGHIENDIQTEEVETTFKARKSLKNI